MREFLKKVYAESDWGCRLLFPLVQARDWLREGWRSDRRVIERQFQAAFGRPMDWRDPRTLNEKMNWMKLHFRDPLQRVVADKYAVREHVQAKIGAEYLIPLIRTYERAEDIRLAELPSAFALKVNHGSGQNWLVQDKAREDEGRIRREFYKWMRISHYAASREWPYRGIRPLIVAEELLLDENHAIPSDIKFHCFHGRAATIQVDLDRATNHRRNFTIWTGSFSPSSGPSGRGSARPGPTGGPLRAPKSWRK